MNFFSKKDHKKLSKNVEKIKHKWLVSYDNSEFIINLYPNQRKLIYRLSQSASNRIGNEILIFSDQMSFQNSKDKLANPVFI